MSTGTYGIATELEAKTKIGSTASVNNSMLITKNRVYAIGGIVLSSNSYAQNQCVKYSDIDVPTPVMYTWAMANNLVWTYTETSATEPVPAKRLDAEFLQFNNNREAEYRSWSPLMLPKSYESLDVYQLSGVQSTTPTPISFPAKGNEYTLKLISNCTPEINFLQFNGHVPFSTVHTNVLNYYDNQYYDEDESTNNYIPAIKNEFQHMIFDVSELLTYYLIGSPGFYDYIINKYNVHLPYACMKAGQQFFMIYQHLVDGDSFTEISLTMLEWIKGQNSGNILKKSYITPNRPTPFTKLFVYYVYDKGKQVSVLDITEDPTSYDADPYGILVYSITFQYNNHRDVLIRFRREYQMQVERAQGKKASEVCDLIYPFLCDIAFNISDKKMYNNPISLIYDFKQRFVHSMYQKIHSYSLGIDSLAMYQIRFFQGMILDGGELILPSALNLSTQQDKNSEGFNQVPYGIRDLGWVNTFTDFCIPNQKVSQNKIMPEGIEVQVSAKKLDPGKNLYDRAVGFGVTYLRSPVLFNDTINLHGNTLNAVNEMSLQYSMFQYESELSHAPSSLPYISLQNIIYNYFNKLPGMSANVAKSIAKANVPYIIIYDPESGVDDSFHGEIDHGFLNYLWREGFFGTMDDLMIIWDTQMAYDIFIPFGDGWWGIPEWLFFQRIPRGLKNFADFVKVLAAPRAVQIVIPLSEFGSIYNTFYQRAELILDKIYFYYKTFYYEYDLL